MRLPFGSLVSRLIMVGLLQLVVVAGTALAIYILEGPHDEARPTDHLDRATRERLEQLVDAPAALGRALVALEDHRIDVTLYDDKRQLIASNVEPPLAIPRRRGPPPGAHLPPDEPGQPFRLPDDRGPPPGAHLPPNEPGQPSRLPDDRGPRYGPRGEGPPPFFDEAGSDLPHVMVAPFHPHGVRGFLVARGRAGAPPGLIGPVLALISGFLVLVGGALIIARWVLRPIDRLARAARSLGEGDLSARARLARPDEIGQLGERFDEMAERIEGLLVSEKELLANVAHELRTPLTRIGVALDLASEGDANAARESLAEIAVDVSELETIVDDILTAMRFEIASTKTQLPLRSAPNAPGVIAAASIDRLRVRHPDRPLELHVASDLPMIDVDPMLVRRVIDNLIENAHKYTPDRMLPTELVVSRTGDAVVFAVRDRGIGISAEDLPRVFTAFFRGDRSRSRETGGVGLGLTLAKRIVEAHGGTIAVASASEAGTTVTVRIPVAK